MKNWFTNYISAQKAALDSIPFEGVEGIVKLLQAAHRDNKQVFVFGNGGNAANSSHFATDLGKGASDKLDKRFRVQSLNDNTAWMTAISNDYSYEDVFLRQLQNFGVSGDVVISASVSGNSPNCVKALQWARQNGLHTVAIVGAARGCMTETAEHVIVIEDKHYGRVEDAQMLIYHMLCYAFMEKVV